MMKIKACVNGMTIALEYVKDEVFSQKMMGDGIGIFPESDNIVAPMDGVITMIFPTHHAIGIKSSQIELLIHVGIDTVNLQGKFFKCHVKENQQVKAGDKLITFKRKKIQKEGYPLDTLMIITKKTDDMLISKIKHKTKVVANLDTVLEILP